MSRGGRGGFGGAASNRIGIDIDVSFIEEANRFNEEQNRVEADRLKSNGLTKEQDSFVWPAYPGGVPRAPLPTAREKQAYEIGRARRERIRNSAFWTGDPGDIEELTRREARDPSNFDAFGDSDTYANRLKGPKFTLPDLTKHKWANPGVSHPRELWATMGYKPETYEEDRKLRKTQPTKKLRDPLSAILDDDDTGDKTGADDDDDEMAEEQEEEGVDAEQEDDDFDEDDDDADNDYNAEQYFDGGEDDHDDYGEEGGGGDDY